MSKKKRTRRRPLDLRPPTRMEISHMHDVFFKDTGRRAGKRRHTHRIGKREFPHEV